MCWSVGRELTFGPDARLGALHDNGPSVEQEELRHPNARQAVPRHLGAHTAVAQLRHPDAAPAQRELGLMAAAPAVSAPPGPIPPVILVNISYF